MARRAQPVGLSDAEVAALTRIVRRGDTPGRTRLRAWVLTLLHGGQPRTMIATTVGRSVATVDNIKRRYLTEGLDAMLYDQPRSDKPVPIDETARAQITALACSAAPAGHPRWTLHLLAEQAVARGVVKSISAPTVKAILKQTLFRAIAHRGKAADR
jgi:transposase